MEKLKSKPAYAPVREPPKRWRNKYRSLEAAPLIVGNAVEYYGPGEWWGLTIYPSKEIAEARAQFALTDHSFWTVDYGVEYLGAFPVEGE